MITGDQMRDMELRPLLQLIQKQVGLALMLTDIGGLRMVKEPPKTKEELRGEPILRIGDFTIYPRDEKP
jgi:hypothetical protein